MDFLLFVYNTLDFLLCTFLVGYFFFSRKALANFFQSTKS